MDLFDELRGVAQALDAASISYALCGGLAVGAHGHVRATKDIDLLILPEDLDGATLSLSGVGFVHSGGEIPVPRPSGSARRLHRLTKVDESDHITVDLLLVEDDVLREAWATRVVLDVEEFTLCVLSRQGLVAMKRDSDRAIDRDDIAKLCNDD